MKKIISAFMAAVLTAAVIAPPQVHAASAIKIYIDGTELVTDQAPVVSGSRTFVPLRGIFEALDADVLWDQRSQTVTSYKDDTTVVLTLGSRTATINGEVVSLDSPAFSRNGRTLVPLRFVSEALGQTVDWQPASRIVIIHTNGDSGEVTPGTVDSVSYVSARVTGQNGNGSDVVVNFARPDYTANITGYRIFIVKAADASGFTEAKALRVNGSNYTAVSSAGGDQSVSLTAQTRDVDGNILAADSSYKVFVMTLGNSGDYALSSPSDTFTLTGNSVPAASNVSISDVADYGDGRDLAVSFTKASSESNISGYRVFIVKTANASRFTLSAANAVSSSNYTSVGKAGSTLSTVLNAGSRDTSGELLKNGVSYTAFVLSVSSKPSASASRLSAASSPLILSASNQAPVLSSVTDNSNYGDGRDLQVSFTKASDESKVANYRIYVVRADSAGSFTLSAANAASRDRYYEVSKNGNKTLTTVLPNTLKDVQGYAVTEGVSYKVFVMAVSNNSSKYPNWLSAPSAAITLSDSGVAAVSSLKASDTSDYGDGRDLQVSFTDAKSESSISEYRVFVVKSADAGSFTLSKASKLSGSYYTSVSLSGSTHNLNLDKNARSTDGALIVNGTGYKVFVLSVAKNGNVNNNVLSSPSSSITLSVNKGVPAVSNLKVSDIADNGDGRDLQVSFDKASTETGINGYRVFVVKANEAGSFTLSKASSLSSSYYTSVPKTGSNLSLALNSYTRSVDGDIVGKGQSYKVFVLTVGSGTNGALSAASSSITLTDNKSLGAVSNLTVSDIADNGNAGDLKVKFSKAADESQIGSYRIMVVKDSDASSFTLAKANNVTSSYYKKVSTTGGDYSVNLDDWLRTVNGEAITNGTAYRIFVLSVGKSGYSGSNKLSAASSAITLTRNLTISPATEVKASLNDDNASLKVTFTKSESENLISEYRILVVPSDRGSFKLSDAEAVDGAGYLSTGKEGAAVTKTIASDISGAALKPGAGYKVYVLAVSNGTADTPDVLSAASDTVEIPAPAPASAADSDSSVDSGQQQAQP
ncbi:copper amine oxidase N-terminal domain-containing protein [Paenibacillus pinistramenti]|uniref:copper amine oxidase N-terminal domain-containing protein n=1 Tax=Paenibacillus pinistramenti TaxID=1768003 RepID=UPI001109C011|nr:copper amine oxidase N-terminal domain-containing protein [Paenibacillus pinistramenti]